MHIILNQLGNMSKIYMLLFISLITITSCDNIIQKRVYHRTEKNYGGEVDKLAIKFDLPSEYLKALIILECSGKRNIPPRFEKHVLKQLKLVRAGKRKKYGPITQKDISNASNSALKNLASSWGPFQLMGYKCLQLDIKVQDVRGEQSLYWGIKWINEEYGDLIREEKYEEAFRIHNTGKPNGRTHDPNYVKNGLKYIDYFKNN